ncbi:MAG: DUF4291 domain-containing protein [Bacteroidota bacterium]
MFLEQIRYVDYETGLPQHGNHILAQQGTDSLFVYQAYNAQIAAYAVAHQRFGGTHYSFNRMSWIKPNFLWMMYRCGWASKENQERVLAIEIRQVDFERILEAAVHSSFKPNLYQTRESWQKDLQNSEVRIQWDPDHTPTGGKLERRAIQLGLKGQILRSFATEWVLSIQDITPFVLAQGERVQARQMEALQVVKETVYQVQSDSARQYLQLD